VFRENGAATLLPAVAVAIVVLCVNAFSLDPDVGFWDTGELQTVAYILGLAHPTGYPTEILAGWLFTHAVPFGEPAFRMNLFCMVCVVVSAACGCGIAILCGALPSLAVAAALCFAFTPVVWGHATHADVTDPALLLCSLTLLSTVVALRAKNLQLLVLSAVLAGLALGTHGVVIWFLPVVVVLIATGWDRPIRYALQMWVATACATAVAVYSYLPIRSAIVTAQHLDPTRTIGLPAGMAFWDLGHPSSWNGFLSIVSGAPVGATHSLPAILHANEYWAYASFLGVHLRQNYPAPVLVTAGLSALLGIATSRRLAVLLLPLVLVTPFASSFKAETDVDRYFTIPLMCLWIVAAVGASRLEIKRFGGAPALMALVFVAVAATEVYQSRSLFAARSDRLGSKYVASVLASTGRHSIVIAPWVYATPLGYAAYVRHETAERIVVAMPAESAAPYLRAWLRTWTVYAVSESPPNTKFRATFIGRLHVNPDPAHDPKLYELSGTGDS